MVHVFVKKLVDEWAKAGHNCVVISLVGYTFGMSNKNAEIPYHIKEEIEKGVYVDVYRPKICRLPNFKLCGISVKKYYRQTCIENTIRKIGVKFDFIYSHFFDAAVEGWHYAHVNNIPLFVATGESVIQLPDKPCRSFSVDRFRNELCGVVAVSSKNKIEASTLGIIDEDKAKVFPNGANLSLFKKKDKQECRTILGLPKDCFIIICVGQFIERKGQRRILQALDKINDNKIKTIFVGKGVDDFQHPSILFKGTVDNVSLPCYLNASDLFVLPTRKEGCCNAIIEALACGLPIISSDLSFNHDVLNENNSILVDPDNIEEIADGIKAIMSNPEMANKLAEESYKQGLQLSIETRAVNILKFIQERLSAQR